MRRVFSFWPWYGVTVLWGEYDLLTISSPVGSKYDYKGILGSI